jgi:hypothetical protein
LIGPFNFAFVPGSGVRAVQAELVDKNYRCMKPGAEEAPWGLEMQVVDAFNNRITFCERC